MNDNKDTNNKEEIVLDGIESNMTVDIPADVVKEQEQDNSEYEKYLKDKMLKDAERRQRRVNKDKALMHTIETNGWDGLDGGQRYNDLAPDSAGRKLTAREINFCRYYVCTNNIKQSLVLAGMAGTNSQMKIIHKPEIRAFISELTDLRLKKLGYDRNTVIKNLAIISNQDVSDYIDIVKTPKKAKDGSTYIRTDLEIKDFDEVNKDYVTDEYGEKLLDDNGNPILISSEKTKAIKSIRYNDNGQVTLEFHDKMQALKQLANMLDMESPTKITLNDETKREQTEQSILKKLQALTSNNEVVSSIEETKQDDNSNTDNIDNKDTPEQ